MKSTVSAQDFWCITLDQDNRECIWKHDDEEISHHLMIEQVVLGLNCKDNCMVEATSCLASGEERSTMICQLVPSAVPNCKLSLCFKQVKLKLAAGDGSVYLTGTHSQETKEDADSESVEEYTESELKGQEKLNSQRHHILELQGTVKKLESEVWNLKNHCRNTVTSGQGKVREHDEDSQEKYRALSQRLDKEKLKSQRLEILELQRTVKEMEQEMNLTKYNYSADKENTTCTPQLSDQEYSDSQNWEISQLKRKVREMEDGMRPPKSPCTVDKGNRDSHFVDREYCNNHNRKISQLKMKDRQMDDGIRPFKNPCTGSNLLVEPPYKKKRHHVDYKPTHHCSLTVDKFSFALKEEPHYISINSMINKLLEYSLKEKIITHDELAWPGAAKIVKMSGCSELNCLNYKFIDSLIVAVRKHAPDFTHRAIKNILRKRVFYIKKFKEQKQTCNGNVDDGKVGQLELSETLN